MADLDAYRRRELLSQIRRERKDRENEHPITARVSDGSIAFKLRRAIDGGLVVEGYRHHVESLL